MYTRYDRNNNGRRDAQNDNDNNSNYCITAKLDK